MSDLELLYFEDLEEVDFLRVQKFLNMDLDQLKQIKPVWAINEYEDQAIDRSVQNQPEKYKIVFIEPKNLIRNANLLELRSDRLFTGEINDSRYATTLELWEERKPVDPPKVTYNENSNKRLVITDGRHRTVLANYLGLSKIPIIILKADHNRLLEFLIE